MSKKLEFINYVKEMQAHCSTVQMSEGAQSYWEAFCAIDEVEKPMFTDNGKLILQFLQNNPDTKLWKAKDIAEGLFVSSRTVSGAIRKLVSDGFVEKVSKDPVIYTITENGKNIKID